MQSVEVEELLTRYRLNYIEASINRCVDKTSHRTIYCVSNSTMATRKAGESGFATFVLQAYASRLAGLSL